MPGRAASIPAPGTDPGAAKSLVKLPPSPASSHPVPAQAQARPSRGQRPGRPDAGRGPDDGDDDDGAQAHVAVCPAIAS